MSTLRRCSSCSGFVPSSASSCPNCDATEVERSRIGTWIKAAAGGAIAVTMMACYGVPPEGPDLPTAPGPDKPKETLEVDKPAVEQPTVEQPTVEQPKAEGPDGEDAEAEAGQPDAPE